MKISIVTISFNQKKYLRECIDSVLEQKECEVEYIVVDPGSTDGSRELIESYGDRIVKVFDSDSGPADGLHKGFSHATGGIYGFINSDDYYLPNALSKVKEFFDCRNTNCFMTGQGYSEDAFGIRTPIAPSILSAREMLHRSAVVFQQSTFFPASLYEKVGGINTLNRTCWDYELFLNFLQHGAEHFIDKNELAVFRLYADSISGSGRLKKRYFQELDEIFLGALGRKRSYFDKILTIYLRTKRQILKRFIQVS